MKKFAIAGDGEVANLHAKNIQRRGKLVAVCGSDETETEAVAAEYNAKAYRSFDEMLNAEGDLDVVVVGSPVGFHAEQVIKSLQAGKDVLCESPLCLTKAAAWQIIETEKYCRRRVYLVQLPKFYEPFGRMKNEMEERRAKTRSFHLNCSLILPESFRDGADGKRFPGGGLLYKPFGLLVDLLVSLFGDIVSAEGFLGYPSDKKDEGVEDTGAVSLKMQKDVVGTLHWSSVISEQPMISIFAENGFSQAHLEEPMLMRLQSNRRLSADAIEYTSDGMYKGVYDSLLKVIRDKDVNFPGSIDGAKTVEAIEKIYKAVR